MERMGTDHGMGCIVAWDSAEYGKPRFGAERKGLGRGLVRTGEVWLGKPRNGKDPGGDGRGTARKGVAGIRERKGLERLGQDGPGKAWIMEWRGKPWTGEDWPGSRLGPAGLGWAR